MAELTQAMFSSLHHSHGSLLRKTDLEGAPGAIWETSPFVNGHRQLSTLPLS